MLIRIQKADHEKIMELVDILRTDVLLFTGMAFLDKYKLYVDNVENGLCPTQINLNICLTREHSHLYFDWSKANLYCKRR